MKPNKTCVFVPTIMIGYSHHAKPFVECNFVSTTKCGLDSLRCWKRETSTSCSLPARLHDQRSWTCITIILLLSHEFLSLDKEDDLDPPLPQPLASRQLCPGQLVPRAKVLNQSVNERWAQKERWFVGMTRLPRVTCLCKRARGQNGSCKKGAWHGTSLHTSVC